MSKQEADGLHTIDTAFLKKHGYLNKECYYRGGRATYSVRGEPSGSISISTTKDEHGRSITFDYTITYHSTGEKKHFRYKNMFDEDKCYFGGSRYYFICGLSKNGVYCGRRATKLYMGGDYYGCRHCYELTYNSRNKSHSYRMLDSIFKSDAVEEKIQQLKRWHYQGKPTKKYARLLKKREWAPSVEKMDFINKMLYKNKRASL